MSNLGTYVTLEDAKEQLSIDESLTIHDVRIKKLIGAAEDWAENFTQRSLGELMELDSPRDSDQTALPDPVDSPHKPPWNCALPEPDWLGWPQSTWTVQHWQMYWANNPIHKDQSKPLRRDVYAGILLYMESLFDRNTDNFVLLQKRAEDLLWPYRIALGV